MTAVPLRRNRDFVLLQIGQLLSNAGTSSTSIAFPLLVLAITHSPAKAGIVGFARSLPSALFALPAGLAADRWSRRRLMILADGVRVLAIGSLAATILLDRVVFWEVVAVALVEGSGAALFFGAQPGALRAVVPARQLPAAAAAETGRQAVVRLAGPPLGGALFGLARVLPFLVDALSYAFSTLSLLAMRTPFQEEREPHRAPLGSRLAEGFRFVWNQPFLRTCALLFGLTNFIGPGMLFAVVVIGRQQGLCAIFLVWPNVYVLTAGILPTALAIPSTDSVVHGYRIAMTPDRLLGRAESVRSLISLLIAPLGPLAAGILLSAVSARATIAVFATVGVVLAVWGSLSPAIRAAPTLDDLDELP